MSITATELKMNLGKYLKQAEKEDVIITKNGKEVARLTKAHKSKMSTIRKLYGSVPKTMTLEESKEERLNKI